MAKEYIEREALKRDLIDNRNFYPSIVKNAIETAPTADVVEVVHGEWRKSQFAGKSGFYNLRDVICSECETCCTFLHDKNTPMNYCPNCGAKMDGKGDE